MKYQPNEAPLDWYVHVGGLVLATLLLIIAPDWIQYWAKVAYNAVPALPDVEVDRPSQSVQASLNQGFEKALGFVLQKEGGYVDHPNDVGGATNQGVIQSTYDAWRDRQHLPSQNVANITQAEVQQIYKEYWDAGNCGQFATPLNTACLDSMVNFGIEGGKSFFTNLPADPKEAVIEVAERRKAYRYQRVAERPDQQVFLNGWLNRDEALKQLAGQQ